MRATNVVIILFSCNFLAVFTSDSKIEWISGDLSQAPLALQHHDGIEGSIYTYICRTRLNIGYLYSGKLVFYQNMAPLCHISYDDKEVRNEDFEVLSAPKGSLSWQIYDGNENETNLIQGGQRFPPISVNFPHYVCRGFPFTGSRILVIGYFYPNNGLCRIAYYKSIELTQFEVLRKNHYGTLLNY